MKLFVSVFVYNAVRSGAFTGDPSEDSKRVPGVKTLTRLAALGHDVSPERTAFLATPRIALARSRASGLALKSGADLWVTIDEDVDASSDALFALCGFDHTYVTIAAMGLRDRSGLNVEWSRARPSGADHASVKRGGVALAAIPLVALRRIADYHASLRFDDDEKAAGKDCPALFFETIEGRVWKGEDYKFCERAWEAGVGVQAFVHRGVTHNGIPNSEVM